MEDKMKGTVIIKYKFVKGSRKDNNEFDAGILKSAQLQGFKFVGSGYNFCTLVRDLQFEK